jgi:hypothetical protein
LSCYNTTINVRETRRRDPESRDTGNNEYTRHRTKTNKTKNTTQKTKKISNTDATMLYLFAHILYIFGCVFILQMIFYLDFFFPISLPRL